MLSLAFAILLAAAIPASSGEQLYTTHCASCHGIDAQRSDPARRGACLGRLLSDHRPHAGRRPRSPGRRARPPHRRTAAAGPDPRARRLSRPGSRRRPADPARRHGRRDRKRAPAVRAALHAVSRGARQRRRSRRARLGAGAARRDGPSGRGRGAGGSGRDAAVRRAAALDGLAAYVTQLQTAGQPRVVPPFRSTGPVPEGAVGYLAIVALVAFVFIFWRTDTPAPHREESVRRDEGQKPG
jgi:cytochrome c1